MLEIRVTHLGVRMYVRLSQGSEAYDKAYGSSPDVNNSQDTSNEHQTRGLDFITLENLTKQTRRPTSKYNHKAYRKKKT